MKKYSISPLMLMLMAAFIVIDGTVFAVWSVLCALLHESAHIIALRAVGGRVRSLSVGGKGIALKTEGLGYKDEAIVALAGPAASLALFLVFGALSYLYAFERNLLFIAVSNLALFLVNGMPIYPLDMGRALFCMLCMRLDRAAAVKISRLVSFIFLLPLSIISVIILVRSGFNLSLLIICIYLLILLTGAFNI